MTADQNAARELPVPRRRYGRRALMLGAAAAGAGAAAGLAAPDPAEASNGQPVLLGKSNKATATTSITNKLGNAIAGASTNAIGVRGSSVNATGVYASGAIALSVDGPVTFSTSGVATVKKGTRSVTVSSASAATYSVVLATIQQDRPGITVQSAVPANGSFTITLTGKPAADTPVGWFLIEVL